MERPRMQAAYHASGPEQEGKMDTVRVDDRGTRQGYVRLFHPEELAPEGLDVRAEDLVPVCEASYPHRQCACGKARILWAGQEDTT